MRGILNLKITWLDMTILMSRLRKLFLLIHSHYNRVMITTSELFLLIHSHYNRVMITTSDTRYHMLAKLYLLALELYINCALIFHFLLCFDFSILHADVAGQVLTMCKLPLIDWCYVDEKRTDGDNLTCIGNSFDKLSVRFCVEQLSLFMWMQSIDDVQT
jgi:hypothetical protein